MSLIQENDIFVECGKVGKPIKDVFIMDCHCHLGYTKRLRIIDGSVESLISAMDRMGVDIAAASSLTACMEGTEGFVTRGNDIVIDAVKRYPERIFGYMSINPRYEKEGENELKRCLNAGLRGIKIHSGQGTPYNHESYYFVWEFAQDNKLPLLAHTCTSEIEELEPFFGKYPQVTWIMAHAGISKNTYDYVRIAEKYPNVYIDTVYSVCPRGMVEYFVSNGIEDKILWGTDIAFMGGYQQLGRVLFAKISYEQKVKILGVNAKKVFKLESCIGEGKG